ncbi:MAG: alpha-1,2-fucosyltransferase [Vicinamibacterales bacterium]|nr:alpha-1,2-fucosyltransferase [Vicinamibacterales bacterium]
MRGAVEVVIDAGLGNAMFEYAIGRALAVRHGRPLVLDTSFLCLSPGWTFDLPCFRLGVQQVREMPFLLWRARRKALRILDRAGLAPIRWVQESGQQFDAEVMNVHQPCILMGYWQSERYFQSVEKQLREEFTIVPEQDPRSAWCLARIRQVPSIALHVRRGDYLVSGDTEDVHGTCSLEYYEAALRLIVPRLGPRAELFVFSDDIPWARQHIRFNLPTVFVDWNLERNYEDLRLMSSCRAVITANSTFSWWAGWLNPHPDKTVVVPRQWFRKAGMVSDLPSAAWVTAI